MKDQTKEKRIRAAQKVIVPVISSVASILTAIQAVTDCIDDGRINGPSIVLALLSLSCWLSVSIINSFSLKDYNRSEAVNEVTKNVLQSTQQVNETKARNVLQPAYGEVPFWRSLNYADNILPYDVHGHIRELLLSMKESILASNSRLTSDTLSVDLMYCYPNEEYSGYLPISEENGMKKVQRWKMITSGNTSQMNTKVHSYLTRIDSFYTHLSNRSYVFVNDKSKADKNYIRNGKDDEYSDKSGSIVGLALEIRNDEPEEIFVKAFLTVSTYGARLWEKGDAIDEETFKTIFKANVIDSWRYYLETELAQMYIRHEIRGGRMCQYTGLRAGTHKKCDVVCDNCGKCSFAEERKTAIRNLRFAILETGVRCTEEHNCFVRSIKVKLKPTETIKTMVVK